MVANDQSLMALYKDHHEGQRCLQGLRTQFMPSGLVYLYQMDESICQLRGVCFNVYLFFFFFFFFFLGGGGEGVLFYFKEK